MNRTEIFNRSRDVVNALEEKKAEDIILIDISQITYFTDFFIICSGTSDRMIRSLVKSAVETMKLKYNFSGRVIGEPTNGWIAVDFSDFVLHIFAPKQREYYDLESLWSAGKILLRVT